MVEFPRMETTTPKSLVLYLALTVDQYSATQRGEAAIPDSYSGRFGLRSSPKAAIDRAQRFVNWGRGESLQQPPKSFTIVQVEITPIGYMTKAEEDIFYKFNVGEYRWQGPIRAEEFDESGNLLYRFGPRAAVYE